MLGLPQHPFAALAAKVELDDLHAKYQHLHDATQTKTGASGGLAGVGSRPCLRIMEVVSGVLRMKYVYCRYIVP